MSLIHWWPLTEDFNDKIGTNNLTNTGVTFTSSGKIGQAALFDNDNDILRASNLAELSALQQYSISCWVYLSSTATNHSSAFLSSGDWNTPNEQVCFGVYSYSNGYTTLLVPNGSGWSTGINISSNKVLLNQWYHIAITYNGTKTDAYINGNYVGSYTGGGINSNTVGYYYLGSATYYRGFTMKGRLNDVRIYNHALSKKEVRELSKALVLHYTFDNSSFESTTNLLSNMVTNFSDSSLGTYSGFQNQMGTNSLIEVRDFQNKRCLYLRGGSGSNNRCYIYKDVAGSTKYTFSCDIYSTSQITLRAEGNGGGYGSGWPQVGATTYSATGKWQRVSYTMDVLASPRLYLFFVIPNGVECYINNLQLEEKDHDTVYTPETRTGVIGDGSGLGNSGTLHLPQYYKYSYDSIVGIGGLHCTGETNSGPMHIDTTFNPSFINGTGTVCVWYKKDPVALESQYNNGNFILATPDRSKESGWLCATSAGSAATNVSNCSYTTWYYDGEARSESNEKDTNWHFYCATGVNLSNWTTFQIHSHGDKSWLYRGTIADYRVYNTILSEDDVAELYKSCWAANKEGQIFSNAINEGQSTHQITRSGVERCNELNEIPLPPGCQRVEYIQSTGSSYIDTGIAPGTTLRFRTIVSDISSSAYIITQGNYGLRGYAGTFTNFVSGRRFRGSVTITSGVRYVVAGSNDGIWINDIAGVQETDNDSPSGNVKLMASGNGKMYECMLWDDNTLVRAFVPVIASDGEPCMYDYVTKQCYGSSTDTAFTSGGNIINKVRYDKNGNIYCAEFNEI